jgi:hypothetical protein
VGSIFLRRITQQRILKIACDTLGENPYTGNAACTQAWTSSTFQAATEFLSRGFMDLLTMIPFL